MPEMDLRQIDALVAERVMHDCRHRRVQEFTERTESGLHTYQRCVDCGADISATVMPPYSSDIAAAWQVMERMAALGWLPSLEYERGEWVCHMGHMAYDAGYAVHESAALAVCLAALDALGVEVPEHA